MDIPDKITKTIGNTAFGFNSPSCDLQIRTNNYLGGFKYIPQYPNFDCSNQIDSQANNPPQNWLLVEQMV